MRLKNIVCPTVFLFALLLLGVSHVHAACSQQALNELESGVYELDLGNTKIKIETYNKIAKMKMIGEVNEDWTSVNTADGIGIITGYIGNGSNAQMRSQLVIRMDDGQFHFAIFKRTNMNDDFGEAYFGSGEGIKCIATSLEKWEEVRSRLFPSVASQGVINLEPDGLMG